VLNVYDGVVAGEGDGPMGPDPRPIGLAAAGTDGVALDAVVAWLMGFDWRRIPVIAKAIGPLAGGVRITSFEGEPQTLAVRWIDAEGERTRRLAEIELDLAFAAHPNWKGRIERTDAAAGRGALSRRGG
jgi:uncharacterized protein (DUF362 family)